MHLGFVIMFGALPVLAAAQESPAVTAIHPTHEVAALARALDAIRSIGTPLPAAGAAPFCVRFSGWKPRNVPPPQALPVTKGRLLDRSECPRTYATWVRVVDSAGRDITPTPPPGHVDPFEVEAWRPVLIMPEVVVVRMVVSRGLESWLIHCEVSIASTGTAQCGTIHHLLH